MRRGTPASQVIPDNCADATLCGKPAELIACYSLGNGELHDLVRVRGALSRRRERRRSHAPLPPLRPQARRPASRLGSHLVAPAATSSDGIDWARKTQEEAPTRP